MTSNLDINPKIIRQKYRGKDCMEKLFSSIKSGVGTTHMGMDRERCLWCVADWLFCLGTDFREMYFGIVGQSYNISFNNTVSVNELISVIIPIYNAEEHLKRCLDSVVIQTYSNIEIICINDGSTDSSYEILRDYRKKDERIIIENKTNGGVSSARNFALNICAGEYIVFIDPDDYVEPDYVEYLYDGIKKYCADMSICGYWTYIVGKNIIEDHVFDTEIIDKHVLLENVIYDGEFKSYLWNKMYHKSLFYQNNFNEKLKNHVDVPMLCKLISNSNRIVTLSGKKYHYFFHPNSLSCGLDLKKSTYYCMGLIERFYYLSEQYPEFNEIQVDFLLKIIWKKSVPQIIKHNKDSDLDFFSSEVLPFLKEHHKDIIGSKIIKKRYANVVDIMIHNPNYEWCEMLEQVYVRVGKNKRSTIVNSNIVENLCNKICNTISTVLCKIRK